MHPELDSYELTYIDLNDSKMSSNIFIIRKHDLKGEIRNFKTVSLSVYIF